VLEDQGDVGRAVLVVQRIAQDVQLREGHQVHNGAQVTDVVLFEMEDAQVRQPGQDQDVAQEVSCLVPLPVEVGRMEPRLARQGRQIPHPVVMEVEELQEIHAGQGRDVADVVVVQVEVFQLGQTCQGTDVPDPRPTAVIASRQVQPLEVRRVLQACQVRDAPGGGGQLVQLKHVHRRRIHPSKGILDGGLQGRVRDVDRVLREDQRGQEPPRPHSRQARSSHACTPCPGARARPCPAGSAHGRPPHCTGRTMDLLAWAVPP